ncbi:hypothetical protein BK809_0002839 [Diplodia seriata]|uniref:G-patch domain-containing protein n=1 Tax=Diplodia seriata TaxID=420778 RepID=A0A1S8BKM0_9PEZI|nr:hypothetical protein BK809_0002839 [Diplodia seriata]
MSTSDDDETYTIPIKDQRYFGAGLKRTRVQFVPASSPATLQPSASGPAVSDLYSSIVGGGRNTEPRSEQGSSSSGGGGGSSDGQGHAQSTPEAERCAICNLPLAEGHESSLAHQVSLQHSHPPSVIERSRKGLSFLQAQGWDPDGRKGLGKGGEGILHPIKLKKKQDTVGLGCRVPKNASTHKVEKLNAKETRQSEEALKKRHQRLQNLFYKSDDTLRYLGEDVEG